MPAPLKKTIALPSNAKDPLDVRPTFRGANQHHFLKFRKIARESFQWTATELARQVIVDFAKEFDSNPDNPRFRRLMRSAQESKDWERRLGPMPGETKAEK